MSSAEWIGNAAVYERNRAECEAEAERAERAGNRARAGWWRDMAETWRRRRDRDQHETHERRALELAFPPGSTLAPRFDDLQERFGYDPIDALDEEREAR